MVVGNPKPESRTLLAGERIAAALGGSGCEVIDLVHWQNRLFDQTDGQINDTVAALASRDIVIFASPTYKAAYSGLLKIFLDRIPTGTGLRGVVAIPLMLGAGERHAMAPDLLLKPVLVELGASCPTAGLFLIDRAAQPDPVEDAWLTVWADVVRRAIGARTQ